MATSGWAFLIGGGGTIVMLYVRMTRADRYNRAMRELTGDEARAVQEIGRQQQEGQLTDDEAEAALDTIVRQHREGQREARQRTGDMAKTPGQLHRAEELRRFRRSAKRVILRLLD